MHTHTQTLRCKVNIDYLQLQCSHMMITSNTNLLYLAEIFNIFVIIVTEFTSCYINLTKTMSPCLRGRERERRGRERLNVHVCTAASLTTNITSVLVSFHLYLIALKRYTKELMRCCRTRKLLYLLCFSSASISKQWRPTLKGRDGKCKSKIVGNLHI